MQLKLQLLAIFASGVLLAIVFELLRRRRLIERYALIWLGSSLVLLVPRDLEGTCWTESCRGDGHRVLRPTRCS